MLYNNEHQLVTECLKQLQTLPFPSPDVCLSLPVIFLITQNKEGFYTYIILNQNPILDFNTLYSD